jgi:surfeit locus 1 family protein
MSLYFRPIPKLTVAAVIMFAILLGLGIWQIQRLQWKLNLIATVNHNLTAPPISLADALKLGDGGAAYHRVALTGRFDNSGEAYVFATGPDGQPVYHVLAPFILANGKALMVDRGYVPMALKSPKARKAGESAGTRRIVGVWRIPDAASFFTPQPDLRGRIWFDRDVAAIAKTDHVRLLAPVIIEADATANPGGWPKGGQTVVDFPNNHLQYAITWFALAAGLLLVYFAYHRSQGRLGFK